MVSLRSTTATRPTQAETDGVAGAVCPRVATLAFDVSEAHLWCRCAPPQPPDPTQAGEQNKTGWLGQNAPGLRRWPLTCRSSSGWGRMPQEHGPMTFQRLTCGVAWFHHSHPIPLKPENKTGWLGQYAPGLRRWPLTCRRLSCGVAALHHSHPTLAFDVSVGWRGRCPRNMGL